MLLQLLARVPSMVPAPHSSSLTVLSACFQAPLCHCGFLLEISLVIGAEYSQVQPSLRDFPVTEVTPKLDAQELLN